MFSFFKKNKKDSIPEWASFFSLKEYQHFIAAIDAYFKQKNIPYQLEDGSVKIEDETLNFHSLGLTNIAQTCKHENINLYPEIVNDHFESMAASRKFDIEFQEIVANFHEVKKYFGIRMYTIEQIQSLPQDTVSGKNLSDDLYAMLIFDLPHSVVNIRPDQIEEWNVPINELFAIAHQNIQRKYPAHITSQTAEEIDFFLAQGDHFFVPNIILEIQNQANLLGKQGTLIGIPHRHAALIYPINNIEVAQAINLFLPITLNMYNEGPGSLSPYLFWYKDGTFLMLPHQINDGTLQFFPPQEFINMLNELAPA